MRAFRVPAPRPLFVNSKLIWGLFFGIVAFWALRNISRRAFAGTRSITKLEIGE